MNKLPDYEYVKLVDLCNKFGQQKVGEAIGFSRVVVNRVIKGKQDMSRLMKYVINEQSEETMEYYILLRKAIEYIGDNKERIDDILYSLPEDIKKFYNIGIKPCKNIQ